MKVRTTFDYLMKIVLKIVLEILQKLGFKKSFRILLYGTFQVFCKDSFLQILLVFFKFLLALANVGFSTKPEVIYVQDMTLVTLSIQKVLLLASEIAGRSPQQKGGLFRSLFCVHKFASIHKVYLILSKSYVVVPSTLSLALVGFQSRDNFNLRL